VSGSISGAADYPPAARRAGMEGSVVVRFTVRPDGSVGGCTVTRSNAGPELEATTCALIERRFRYESARDSAWAAGLGSGEPHVRLAVAVATLTSVPARSKKLP
jgi:TonB family protein